MVFKKRGVVFFLFICLAGTLCSCAPGRLKVKKISASYSQYIKGLLSDRLGEPQEAVKFYREAQDFEQHVPSLHLQLGEDYIRLGKFHDAVSEFKKIIELSPDDEYARYVLALLYVQLNDFAKAAAQYEKLLTFNIDDRKENIQLRHILSQLYFLDGNFASAEKHCRQVLRIDPIDSQSLYLMAGIYKREGRIEDAVKNYKEILDYHPQQADAMNALAYLYAEENIELEDALLLAEKATEYEPLNGAFVDTLGWIYFRLGEIDKAISLLEKADKLLLDPEILNHLAEAYYKKGDLKSAKEKWNSSLGLDPTQKEIRKRLKNPK